MKIIIAVFIGSMLCPFLSRCQTIDKTADEAFIITRMAGKFHVEPRAVDEQFSADVFAGMLENTDADRIYFTKNDIARLSIYTKTLDNEIKQRKTGYLNLFISIYGRRLKQADSLINEISKKPFDFYATEKLTVAEDTLYPVSLADMQLKLYKKMKAWALDDLTDDIPGNFKSFAPAQQRRYVDSAGRMLQKKVASALKRKINNILQSPYGMRQHTGNVYCETIASCFDPHTEFFPPEKEEKRISKANWASSRFNSASEQRLIKAAV